MLLKHVRVVDLGLGESVDLGFRNFKERVNGVVPGIKNDGFMS